MSEELENQVKQLAQTLGECIEAAGITYPGAALTGPHLLMFGEDLKRHIEENENANEWRNLAHQFDGHRMSAIGILRAVAEGREGAVEMARAFVNAPPVPGHEIRSELEQLRNEVKTLRTQVTQQTTEPVEFEPEDCESCGCDAVHLKREIVYQCTKCGYGQ